MRTMVVYTFLLLLPLFGWSQKRSQPSFAKVNSSLDEQSPVISPDGTFLFLTIANHPQNVGGKRDPGDIWISTRNGDEWFAPVHAGSLLNDATYNSVLGFSKDGERIFLANHYSANGKATTQGIAVSSKTSSGWSRPVNIGIPYFFNRSQALQGFMSADESVFVFSAESRETLGAEDIYVSLKDGSGNWNEPRNLGNIINTRLQEFSPSLSEDGRTLFFSSNGRQGFGSFDVYASERLDNSWTKWSTPVNAGTNVNSDGRELFYRVYPLSGFALFSSTHNSDGYGDLKTTDLPIQQSDSVKKNPQAEIIVKTPAASTENQLDRKGKGTRVWGRIINGKNQQPLSATIYYQSDSSQMRSTGNDGRYEVWLSSAKEYVIKVESPGYVGTMERLDMNALGMNDLEMNFRLLPIEVGTTINLRNVLFQQSTSNLLPESSDELDMVVAFMNTNPTVVIELGGHTDNRGIHRHNVRLSKERVDKVQEYLVAKGIAPGRISGKGYGGTRPIADNDAEDTRKLNRRVEFTIIKN